MFLVQDAISLYNKEAPACLTGEMLYEITRLTHDSIGLW